MSDFARRLIAWQKRHGRHDLPWQDTRDSYRIWVSEIMLQQTQVTAVIPYYRRFLASFPDVAALAGALPDEVLAHWSGLGYYSRARNLHEAAQIIVREHGGRFPVDYAALLTLPGIGRSTAAAISVFASGARRAILDGNVKRVLARYFAVEGYPGEKRVEDDLWRRAEALLPKRGIEAYTQGLMDLGALVCVRGRPHCDVCPVRSDCVAASRGLTARLPAPRPKKTLPHRTTVMLVLQRAGEVLLEKRPPSGVWGGLWSFPEVAPEEDAVAICAKRYGAHVVPLPALPVVEHGFTHFRLSITPQLLRVSALAPRAAEPGHVWLPLPEARTAAIPAPVRRILAGL
jgi:A/G-specific adenine glycosylase